MNCYRVHGFSMTGHLGATVHCWQPGFRVGTACECGKQVFGSHGRGVPAPKQLDLLAAAGKDGGGK